MKAIDIVKQPPRDSWDAWQRWLNRMQVQLICLPYYQKKTITINKVTNINFIEVRRTN